MRGLHSAGPVQGWPAIVLDSFMHGVGHCWNGAVNVHLRSPLLEDCPDDEEFLNNFDQRMAKRVPWHSGVSPLLPLRNVLRT